jgi:hypothetical protein
MSVLKSLADAKVGQQVMFAYYGGENPGAMRTVLVGEVQEDRIIGTDLDKQETRQYLFEKAAIIEVVKEPIAPDENQRPPVAEAACDVEAEPTTRVRRTPLSFIDARKALHDSIDKLNGDELAEVLAEVQGEDRARFDAPSGQVVLEKDVVIPHCESGHMGTEWVNEDGERIKTNTIIDLDGIVTWCCDGERHTAENFLRKISQHMGLTIS